MVQTMFGEVTVGRSYMEDFWDRSMLDFLDIDEQIAAAEEGDEDAMEAHWLRFT